MLSRGAEAVIYLDTRDGREVIVKDRIKKGYRIPEIDSLIRKQRTKTEERLLGRASRAGVKAPGVMESSDSRIVMEYIEGRSVKESLDTMGEKERKRVYTLIGEALGRMHSANIMHGDFTTSNMILRKEGLYVIDFGLSRFTRRIEDHATDLYLLREAFAAAHFSFLEEAWKNIIKVYKHNYTNSSLALNRFEKITKRRRYR